MRRKNKPSDAFPADASVGATSLEKGGIDNAPLFKGGQALEPVWGGSNINPYADWPSDKIESEIATTDAEIDRMVYDLYGLTDEEIAIVEGK